MTEQEHLRDVREREEKYRQHLHSMRLKHAKELREKVAAARAEGFSDGYTKAKSIEGWRMAHMQMLGIVEAFAEGALLKGDKEALSVAVKQMKSVQLPPQDAS